MPASVAFEPERELLRSPKPKLARIEITSIEDNVTATQLIKSGEFNAHTELVTSTIIQDLGPEFSDGPQIPTSQHFWFNASRAPMDDPKVREALILAVDRDGLIKATFPDGPHKKTDQVINSVPGADNSGFEPYAYDPEGRQEAARRVDLWRAGAAAQDPVRRHLLAGQRGGGAVHRRAVAPEPRHHRRRHEAAAGPVRRP